VPALRFFMARATFAAAFLEYFAIPCSRCDRNDQSSSSVMVPRG
jgi:hypothetical protein